MINLEKLNSEEAHVVDAAAEYSGGGIYLYYGKMSDGRYFLTSDENGDDLGYIEFYSTNPYEAEENGEEIWCEEWMDENRVGGIVSAELWNEMIQWIINNTPQGNYLKGELTERLIKVKEATPGFATDDDVVKFKEYTDKLIMRALGNDDVMNQLCEDGIQITLGEKTLKLYFGAENFNALDSFLKEVIEECEQ